MADEPDVVVAAAPVAAAAPTPKSNSSSKVAGQIGKLKDANSKYKQLLKMAKERIQTQENELEALRGKTNYTWLGACIDRIRIHIVVL